MAYLKAFGVNYILSPRDTAENHQVITCAPTCTRMGRSAARSLPTQAFGRTSEDFLRAQTSQGWVCMRSGAKNRALESGSTSSGRGNKGKVAVVERVTMLFGF